MSPNPGGHTHLFVDLLFGIDKIDDVPGIRCGDVHAAVLWVVEGKRMEAQGTCSIPLCRARCCLEEVNPCAAPLPQEVCEEFWWTNALIMSMPSGHRL